MLEGTKMDSSSTIFHSFMSFYFSFFVGMNPVWVGKKNAKCVKCVVSHITATIEPKSSTTGAPEVPGAAYVSIFIIV